MAELRIAGRAGAAAIFCAFLILCGGGAASAEPTLVDVSDQAIILIQHNRPLVVRTWDRQQIAVDAGGDPPLVERRQMGRFGGGGAMPAPYAVPIAAESVAVPNSEEPPVLLGAEDFVVNPPPGNHDTIRLQLAPSPATVMIPAGTAILSVGGGGNTLIADYHGQLIAQQRFGPLLLRNGGGDAFVQNLRGPIVVLDSTFNRLRTRTALQGTFFSNCTVKQIEASSVRGSLVFDNGTFQPGLARFETATGHVAIGVNSTGGANMNVKGSPGQIFQSFDRPTQFVERNGEATAAVGGGGPLVNVVAQQGKVYLYDGSLSRKGALPPHWGQVREPVERIQRESRGAPPPRPPARPPHRLSRR